MADNQALKKIILDTINETEHKELPIDQFMSLALNHPEHGYYSHKIAIGRQGDFITAPEISQLFGEIIGAWCIHVWMEMGRPKKFRLIELGPGKGTLMADILRAAKIMPDFQNNVSIEIVETNRTLRTIQTQTLADYYSRTKWLDTVDEISEDSPFILIANEFLDALPIKQYMVGSDKAWKERVISLTKQSTLKFAKSATPLDDTTIPPALKTEKPLPSAIYETSPIAKDICQKVAKKAEKCNGYALFIDYGYDSPPPPLKDTLQSVFKHRPSNVLNNIGEQDITSHVDFNIIRQAGLKAGCNVTPLSQQSDFLMSLGIEVRYALLAKNASSDRQRLTMRAGLQRLINPDQMGKLFKVIAYYPKDANEPEGFMSNDDVIPATTSKPSKK